MLCLFLQLLVTVVNLGNASKIKNICVHHHAYYITIKNDISGENSKQNENSVNSVNDAYGFIAKKFEDQNKDPNKDIYKHATTATDTALVEKVFNDVTDIILNKTLEGVGMD